MCIMDILHFAVLNLQVQHPTHVSRHGCKFLNLIFFSLREHNCLPLQMNTHTHTISILIHNTLEYMRKMQKWSCIQKWRKGVQIQSHKITTKWIKIIGFCDPMNIQKMFFLAVLLDNCYKMMTVWLATAFLSDFGNFFCERKQWKHTSWTATLNIKCPQTKIFLARHCVVNDSTQLRVAPSSTIYKPQLCFLNTRCLTDTEEKTSPVSKSLQYRHKPKKISEYCRIKSRSVMVGKWTVGWRCYQNWVMKTTK